MFDVNNNYQGNLFGKDRMGHTTPDLEASDTLRPFLPVPFPAPYLPTLRQDQGHPVLAGPVLSSQAAVGQDKSGALVPAGLFCGTTAASKQIVPTNIAILDNIAKITVANKLAPGALVTIAGITGAFAVVNGQRQVLAASATDFTVFVENADVAAAAPAGAPTVNPVYPGKYCILVYGQNDVGFAWNAQTGAYVAAAGEKAVLAAPTDAVDNDVVTLEDGSTVTVHTADFVFAAACNLFPTGVARPVGVALRNVLPYIGGVKILSTTGGMLYNIDGMNPTGYVVHNYMHEQGTAVQTQYILRLPWIGLTRKALGDFAASDVITGFAQGYGRTFTHFTGNPQIGQGVVASTGQDAGNYTSYDPNVNTPVDLIGRIIGLMNMGQKVGYMNRVRQLWDPSRMVGPTKDPNASSIQMGGSATGGIPYDIHLTTDGIFSKAKRQGKTIRPEYATYVLVRVNL